MNIFSCHGCLNNTNSAVIFSCRSKLVDYYLKKCFVLFENNSNALKNVPLRVKQRINAEHLYTNYFVMACYSLNPSAANTLKIITICIFLHTKFASTYYNYKGKAFRYLFGKYIKPYMKKIDHPALIQE